MEEINIYDLPNKIKETNVLLENYSENKKAENKNWNCLSDKIYNTVSNLTNESLELYIEARFDNSTENLNKGMQAISKAYDIILGATSKNKTKLNNKTNGANNLEK